jgi:hypothetical protein
MTATGARSAQAHLTPVRVRGRLDDARGARITTSSTPRTAANRRATPSGKGPCAPADLLEREAASGRTAEELLRRLVRAVL